MATIISFVTATILPLALKILIALLIYFIGAKLIKFVLNLLDKTFEKTEWEQGVESFLRSAAKIVMYIVLVFIIVSYLGIATTGLAALFASAGVTVGLALSLIHI